MKISKTLAVLFVLLALTVGAVAEEGDIKFMPFKAGEITLTLPTELKLTEEAKVCEEDGVIEISVNTQETEWSNVIVGVDSWGEIGFGLSWLLGDAATNSPLITPVSLNTTEWSKDAFMNVGGGFVDAWGFLSGGEAGKSTSGWAMSGLAMYDASTNTLVPVVYDGENGCYLFAVFFDQSGDPVAAKYATIRITHNDESPREVKLNYVPESRIHTSADAESVKSLGNVSYTLENGTTVTKLNTMVTAPENAVTFVAQGCTSKSGNVADGIEVELTGIQSADYHNAKAASIIWYDEHGEIILAERLDVYVTVGEPKVWPSYITDDEVTKAEAEFIVAKSLNESSAAFADVVFDKATDAWNIASSGTVLNEDMTPYNLFIKFKAPPHAASYAYYPVSYLKVLGAQWTSDAYDHMDRVLADAELTPIEDGVFWSEGLFKEAKFSEDDQLTVYYDKNATAYNTGNVLMIDWYDESGKRINRQWAAWTYDPLSVISSTAVESAVPATAEDPTLICADAGNGYKLQVSSYSQYSVSGTQIQYELKLLDPNSNVTSLSDLKNTGNEEIQLLIPYPDDVDLNNVTFTVNHYEAISDKEDDETASRKDSYVEGVSLERTEAGVLMTIKSLSPFVLSWKAAECKHDNLTYVPSVSGSDKDTEGVITETCKDCVDHKASWVITVDKTCVAGKELAYKVTHSANWKGGDPTITYVDANAMETFTTTPTKLGKYEMVVTFTSGTTLHIPFEVVAAPAMPSTGDNSLPLAALLAIAALALSGSFMLRRKANG